jgi:hypothetical protein
MNKMKQQEPQEPESGDYVFQNSGPLGSRTSVSIVGEKFLGEFPTMEEAEEAVRLHKEKHQFFPNSWYCSDHGNLSLLE